MTDIASLTPAERPFPALPEWARQAQRLLLSDQRSEETKRAYQRDLTTFFAWAGRDSGPESVAWLCTQEVGPLALLLNGYKAHLREVRLSEATINRRLAAVRSLLNFARRLGAPCPDPRGLVSSEKARAYRDTTGPPLASLIQILAEIDTMTIVGLRDAALFYLLIENALRRGEICRCNIGDFEPGRRRLWITGKGRGTQSEPITLSQTASDAIQRYLQARTAGELSVTAPLFLSYGRGSLADDGRLTGNGLWRIVNRYGRKILEQSLHPHALRHSSITALLNATGGNIRMAQRFSRHADIRTLTLYDDNREDLQGEATNLISDLLHNL